MVAAATTYPSNSPPKTPRNACHSLALARETILALYKNFDCHRESIIINRTAIYSYTPTGLHWGYQIISIIVAPLQGYRGISNACYLSYTPTGNVNKRVKQSCHTYGVGV